MSDFLRRTRAAQPDELPAAVNGAVAALGLAVNVYVVDQEQRVLLPLPGDPTRYGPPPQGTSADPAGPRPQPIGTTLAGRSFMTVRPLSASGGQPPAPRLWIPLVDGTERLGVLEVIPTGGSTVVDDPDFRAECTLFAQLIGHLFAAMTPYGDRLVTARRTRRMSEASELLSRLLPPLTYACHRAVISAILEPCYDVGGDGFDYAVDGSTAYVAVFDTTGHDLCAGLGTAVTLSAIRAARRDNDDLPAMTQAADRAMAACLPDLRFTTGVLARLDLDSGLLRYVNAGHPAPMVLRRGGVVARLDQGRRMPLGLGDPQVEVATIRLEPGDRILMFTDGVTEARDRTGDAFGEERLIQLFRQQSAGRLPAPETLRRLCHAALDHYDGPPADDATLLLVEWSQSAVQRALP